MHSMREREPFPFPHMVLAILATKALRNPKLCRAEDLKAQGFGTDVMHELHDICDGMRGRTQSIGILPSMMPRKHN